MLTPPVGIPTVATPESARPVAPPVPPKVVVDPCACGHAKQAHEHYRHGTDCGACGAVECTEYRPERGSLRAAVRRLWTR